MILLSNIRPTMSNTLVVSDMSSLSEESLCPRTGESGCNSPLLPFAIRLQYPEIVYGNHLQSDM